MLCSFYWTIKQFILWIWRILNSYLNLSNCLTKTIGQTSQRKGWDGVSLSLHSYSVISSIKKRTPDALSSIQHGIPPIQINKTRNLLDRRIISTTRLAGGISSVWVLITSGSSLSITEGLEGKVKDKGWREGKHISEEGERVMVGLRCLYNLTSSNIFSICLLSSTHLISVSCKTLTDREWGWGKGEHWGLIPAVTVVRPLHVPPLTGALCTVPSTGLQCLKIYTQFWSHRANKKRIIFIFAGSYSRVLFLKVGIY